MKKVARKIGSFLADVAIMIGIFAVVEVVLFALLVAVLHFTIG